ncbi:tRNA dihydrouridine synthase [Formosa algae]|uniref:tRNA dihydrouridine synthase n=1 Tax=Formosa algae TaxID=225843 RepID=UPI000CCED3B3|nr:tRNA-dihydrouridine synthase family protein [Formosa algae]PNW28522.1 dihydrouridine synthase [Formosa algae]
MSITLLSSPLQGFTDFRFRNAFHQYFGGIDTFYAPYIRLNGKMVIKNNYQRDLNPEHNTVPHLIPQVMTNDPDEFLFVIKYVESLGYTELNWNLGCPYPMVTKQGMGSGMICNPSKIDDVLHKAHNESDITISMKMRMGYDDPTEILGVFPILEKYPIKNVAIHARIGKQLYKGGTDLEAFQNCVNQSPHKLYYNGDVTSVEAYRVLQERFPSIDHWMIGRGLIADPFLPQMIQDNTTTYPENRWEIFKAFHDTIYQQYDEALSGPMPIKMKMLGFWEYFSQSFNDPRKVYKAIKKNGSTRNYKATVSEIFAKQK